MYCLWGPLPARQGSDFIKKYYLSRAWERFVKYSTSGLICYSSHHPLPPPHLCLKRHSNNPNYSTQGKVERDEKCELERCQLLLFFFDRQIHQRHQQTTSTDQRRVRHAGYFFLSSYTVQINKSNKLRKVIQGSQNQAIVTCDTLPAMYCNNVLYHSQDFRQKQNQKVTQKKTKINLKPLT